MYVLYRSPTVGLAGDGILDHVWFPLWVVSIQILLIITDDFYNTGRCSVRGSPELPAPACLPHSTHCSGLAVNVKKMPALLLENSGDKLEAQMVPFHWWGRPCMAVYSVMQSFHWSIWCCSLYSVGRPAPGCSVSHDLSDRSECCCCKCKQVVRHPDETFLILNLTHPEPACHFHLSI